MECNHSILKSHGWTDNWTGRDEDVFVCTKCSKWWTWLKAYGFVEQGIYTYNHDTGIMTKEVIDK